MRYEYVVSIKRDNEKHIDTISFCLCALSALAFTFEQFRTAHFIFFLSFATAIIVVGLTLNFISAKKGNQVRYRNWLFIAGIFWIGMPYLQWLAAIFFILAFLEYQAKYPLEVGFSQDEIVINSLFKKKIPWSQFNNIILKDGLLTLDMKNNKIFQKEVLDEDEPDADEDEFNEYCQERLGGRES